MKIKTAEHLEAKIDHELQWRKHEITTLKFALKEAREHQLSVFFRSAIVLLYAHWEGVVKFMAKTYINFLNAQGHGYNQMTASFAFFAIKKEIENPSSLNLNNYGQFEKARRFFTEALVAKFQADAESCISTKENQNLTSSEFRVIIGKLGFDYLPIYELREKLIDEKLLKFRNIIAHGGHPSQSEVGDRRAEFELLSDKILEMVESFRGQLTLAIQNKSFLLTLGS